MSAQVIHLGENPDPAQRLRDRWAESLNDHLAVLFPDAKTRSARASRFLPLLAEHGIDVSRQAVDSWLAAKSSPRPHLQAGVAAAIGAPVRALFPLEQVA